MIQRRWCPRCGIVRDFTAMYPHSMPWCRHGDISLPAERMERIPKWHPLAGGDLPRDMVQR